MRSTLYTVAARGERKDHSEQSVHDKNTPYSVHEGLTPHRNRDDTEDMFEDSCDAGKKTKTRS